MRPSRTIRASEVASFVFCERAWELERRGVQPNTAAAAKRAAGSVWHKHDSERVAAAPRQRRAGVAFVAAALLAFLVLIVWALARGVIR